MAGKMLDYDGPIVHFTERVGQLIWLNILTIVCCLPVATMGASFAALNPVVLKMSRNEEGYITKQFFKAFKANLNVGIKASIAIILFVGIAYADFYAISLLDVWFADIAWVLLIIFAILFAITVTFLFPIMAKFEAGFVDTVKNSFKYAASHIGKTILLFILNILLWVICYFLNFLAPVLFLWGFSMPAYLGTGLYKDEFKAMEDAYFSEKEEQGTPDER